MAAELASLFDSLNLAQRKAVQADDGPTLVIAGPGSGKTRVLTSRIAYLLLARKTPAHRIMAVTFTNKAANEMRERLNRMMGAAQTGEMSIGTFHSICARLLRRDAPLIGVDHHFAIFDADDQLSVVKTALAELNIDEKKYKPAAVHSVISRAKNDLIWPDQFQPKTYFEEIVGRVYVRYNQILRANNALDFDDLLIETVRLLQHNPSVCQRVQERYLHLLVDEFQDTNLAQYVLVKWIAGKHRNVFCVGDPDQSIYAWRGADYRNVLRLQEDFPDLNVVALDQNYRSTQTILDAAMSVIRRNPNRRHIKLFTERGQGPKIVVRELYTDDEEAQYVVDTIRELIDHGAAAPGEIAVMYRTNAQSRALEDAFVRAGMPYRLVGATRFYARKEVKDVLAYLRIVNNPADSVSLRRIVNVPPRGIGDKTFAQIEEAARANGTPIYQSLTTGQLAGRAARALADFAALWRNWIDLRDELAVGQLFDHILQTSGYRDYLKDGTEEGEERWANVMELRNVAFGAGDMPLGDFLNEVALVSDIDNYDESANAPTLLTLHAAKGLEFRVVFIVGLEDGLLPHSRSLDNPDQMAEERRLMYVGITRAKDRLYLLRAFRRSAWGTSDMSAPSRFLDDLPAELLNLGGRSKEKQPSWSAGDLSQTARSPRPPVEFTPGQRVYHQKFGEGIVLRSTRQRDDEEVEVFFAKSGLKRLSATISGLKKIE
ncbi:MAG: UvrD-helicase domain-containing protein [Anaerolineae bacterium]|nr:UvrD-helicase domain-containing protein [Thermoflexales bacterium]MDW8408640.1 UvrD-helicase domain-containing protein [Anaerolineae bacterium]